MLTVVTVAAATGGVEESRSVELIGTPQQAALLLLFNDTAAEADQPPLPLALGGACRRLGLAHAEGCALVASLVASKVLLPPDARRPHVAEYEPDSQLELRPGFGQKTARGRRRIKLTTVEAAPQQLLRSGSSARGGRAGSGSAREQAAEMEDREARGTEVDESLFVGSPRSSGPRRNGAFSCTSAPVGGILTWPVRGRGGAWRWSGLVDHG